MGYIYNGILLSHKKEWNSAICRDVDGPRECHTEWSKSEKSEYRILMHICGIQENGINESILQSRNRDTDIENKHMNTKRGRGWVGWIGRLGLTYIYYYA